MEKEMRNQCEGFEKEKSLSIAKKEYLNAYRQSGTAAGAAKIMGVRIATAREQLRDISNRLGFERTSDLLGDKESSLPLRVSKRKSDATAAKMLDMIKKQEYRCALSGVHLEPSNASVDHIVPVSKGGTDCTFNLQWVDSLVNKAKGTMTNEEFILMCKRVSSWNS
jgi:CRISPR/Cas system Type II protein with McrA/HNH and RuvC-like nuclease domain